MFNILSHYCSSYPHFVIGQRNNKKNYGLQFFTKALSCFTLWPEARGRRAELYYLFYLNNKKRIPDDIYNLLTPIALAHWICGDAVAATNIKGLIFCTDSFTLEEVVKLMNVLMIKYRLKCTLRNRGNNQYRIYINQESMNLLRSIVTPYTHYSMLYKLG